MVDAVNATPNEVRESLARRFSANFTLDPLGLTLKMSVSVKIQLFCARMGELYNDTMDIYVANPGKHGSGPRVLPTLSPAGNNIPQAAPTAELVVFWTCRLAVVDEGSMENVVQRIQRLVARGPIGTTHLSPIQKTAMRGFIQDLVHYGQMNIAQWTQILL